MQDGTIKMKQKIAKPPTPLFVDSLFVLNIMKNLFFFFWLSIKLFSSARKDEAVADLITLLSGDVEEGKLSKPMRQEFLCHGL